MYESKIVRSLTIVEKNGKDTETSDEIENEEKKQPEEEKKEEKQKKAGLNSVLFKSLYSENTRIKECLLSIVKKCDEGSISSFCENQEDFTILL